MNWAGSLNPFLWRLWKTYRKTGKFTGKTEKFTGKRNKFTGKQLKFTNKMETTTLLNVKNKPKPRWLVLLQMLFY
ncbi:hypothetical protein A8F94_09310 [Bacillus sp. FJAT-27225]|nr:hypothetical protein A8F94_09310 [Bacillus sp. FJAT-27225]